MELASETLTEPGDMCPDCGGTDLELDYAAFDSNLIFRIACTDDGTAFDIREPEALELFEDGTLTCNDCKGDDA